MTKLQNAMWKRILKANMIMVARTMRMRMQTGKMPREIRR